MELTSEVLAVIGGGITAGAGALAWWTKKLYTDLQRAHRDHTLQLAAIEERHTREILAIAQDVRLTFDAVARAAVKKRQEEHHDTRRLPDPPSAE